MLKKATVSDLPVLRQLCIRTFSDTYAAFNTPENMQDYIAKSFRMEQLLQEMEDRDTSFFLIFEKETAVAYVQLHQSGSKALEIVRIYVSQDHQGKKLGQQLFDHAVQVGKENHCDYLWLGVWENNPNALAFYRKNGMEPFGNHVFKLGADAQNDVLMRKMLRP